MNEETANKILIVEDENLMLEALKEQLEREGFIVSAAKNGNDGLAIALEQKPDLILLDIIMPKMDGLEMLKHLRENDWGREVEVLLLTNLNTAAKVAEAVEIGVHDYLIKSDWTLSGIVDKIKEKL